MKWRDHAFLAGVTELAAAIVPQPRIYLHFGAEFDIARLFDREPLCLVCGQDWDDGMGGTPNPDGFVPELLFGSVSGIPVMAAQHCRSCADGGGVQPIIFPDALAYRLGARDFIYLDAGISLEGELKAGKWAMLTDFISNYGFSPLDGMHSFMPIPYPNLGETLSQYLNSEIINALGVTDSVLRPDSIVYQYSNATTALSEIDWLILKLLYHPEIRCGMDAEACAAVIQTLYH